MKTKIYFAGSISGGRERQEDYFELIKHLSKDNIVLTEHVGNEDTITEVGPRYSKDEKEHVYLRDVAWIGESDLLIADVTIPSLGVGYEIAYAESKGKDILCIYSKDNKKRISWMLLGNKKLKTICYKDLNDAKEQLDKYLNERK